jgi:hypothetical protein
MPGSPIRGHFKSEYIKNHKHEKMPVIFLL